MVATDLPPAGLTNTNTESLVCSQSMRLHCQRKTVLRSNQPALLMLLADYAMGDKLAVCIRWHHIRSDFYAHKTVPEQKARVES